MASFFIFYFFIFENDNFKFFLDPNVIPMIFKKVNWDNFLCFFIFMK